MTRRRRKAKIGEPCHAVKADGYLCPKRSVMVTPDGYGAYCQRHAPVREAL